ncbi:MAG: aminotransferase class V-fold PLP-dependent enzyme, partial [Clostridia bacterium]|nr:aminotransferase class V-fold PLP-dependent enzyme [Clostridia bacterium]
MAICNEVKMIYFDNAATGGYKPPRSYENALFTMRHLNANAGRSGHKLSLAAAEEVFSARKIVASVFGCDSPERVIFTANCTAALNTALFGLLKEGDKVITTVTEHNSVLRPLYELKRTKNINLKFITPKTSAVTLEDLEEIYEPDVAAVVLNAASNVTGTPNDVSGIGGFLKDKKTLFIVDGAQAAGHIT